MQAVSLRSVRRSGAVLAVFRCAMCGERASPLAADAIRRTISCKRCGHHMDMRETTLTAVASVPDSPYEPLLCANASNPILRAMKRALRRVGALLAGSPSDVARLRQIDAK